MSTHETPKSAALSHVGMYAEDPAALAQFYQEVMGMQRVGGSEENSPDGLSVFLSGRPGEEDHELAILSSRSFAHTAFKVVSLGDLREFYAHVIGLGIPIKFQLNHGVSLSFYFEDPEGNIIEIYWPTGLVYGQPYAHGIDLSSSEEDLLGDIKAMGVKVDVEWPAKEGISP